MGACARFRFICVDNCLFGCLLTLFVCLFVCLFVVLLFVVCCLFYLGAGVMQRILFFPCKGHYPGIKGTRPGRFLGYPSGYPPGYRRVLATRAILYFGPNNIRGSHSSVTHHASQMQGPSRVAKTNRKRVYIEQGQSRSDNTTKRCFRKF